VGTVLRSFPRSEPLILNLYDTDLFELEQERIMRNVIATSIISIDGYFEGPGGNVMALNMDAAFDAYNLERIRNAGTVLLGRASYEMFGSFWPAVADAPADPANPALSDVNREFSRIYNQLNKTVVTDTYRPPTDHVWADTTTVVPRSESGQWLKHERERGSGDIVIFASRLLWTGLLAEGHIDQVHLIVGPTALGGGTKLFEHPADLRLLDAQRLDGSDNALLRYEAKR
jgi:dihydrofolate reductase